MEDWTSYLPKNGFKGSISSLPDTTMTLDSNIEENGLSAGALTGQTTGMVDFGKKAQGGGFIRIDSANRRLIVNDGTNDRIIIGYQKDGF